MMGTQLQASLCPTSQPTLQGLSFRSITHENFSTKLQLQTWEQVSKLSGSMENSICTMAAKIIWNFDDLLRLVLQVKAN